MLNTEAIKLIWDERLRQITNEGYSFEHDDCHDRGELAQAAACYALRDQMNGMPDFWPWGSEFWKPNPDDRIRELVKAGALIVAEIERLQRAKTREGL